MSGWVVAVGQALLTVVVAPLLIGWMRLVRARMEGRAGAGRKTLPGCQWRWRHLIHDA